MMPEPEENRWRLTGSGNRMQPSPILCMTVFGRMLEVTEDGEDVVLELNRYLKKVKK